ncbi:MAG TPA: cation:proton antiporter, partial [Vicinamibacterales bacterium]|nr:cation:proton antiporter [Vicinamibacterales bacterium]
MSHLLQLVLVLALVVASAKLAGAAAVRASQPAVFGEILAGLLLGPTLLNVLGWPVFGASDAAPPLLSIVQDLADVGVILLMFVAGLETDVSELRRVGRVAFWSAAGGVALPMAGGIAVASWLGVSIFWEGIFIGTILTATSVSISAQTLMELGVVQSREGSAILGAAVIDDVMGIVVLSVVVAFAQTEGRGGVGQVAMILGRIALFFLAAWVVRPHLDRIAGWGDRLGVSQGLLATVLVVALLFAWAAEFIGGVAAITGAYVAGVFLTSSRFKERIDQGVHPVAYSLLVPVFFISIGLRADARTIGAHPALTLGLIAAAVLGKIAGCGVPARLCGFSPRQSLRVGVGMISRGEVGLIVAAYGLAHHLVGRDVFSAAVLVILVTTMMTPPLLRMTFDRERQGTVTIEEAIAHAPAPDGSL